MRLKGEVVWVLEDALGMCSGSFVDGDGSESIGSDICLQSCHCTSCLERKSTYDKRSTEEKKVYLENRKRENRVMFSLELPSKQCSPPFPEKMSPHSNLGSAMYILKFSLCLGEKVIGKNREMLFT